MAREQKSVAKTNPDATKTKGKRSTDRREPATPQTMTQEAKDLRALAQMLNAKNAPETSKDITAFAKETLKLVAKSQKSDSAAFKREATKALIEFRNFIEKTEKVTELRRTKLLSDIDGVALDAKNATLMMLSVARTQAKNIKMAAHKEAMAEKLKIKEMEKQVLSEANIKAKALQEDTKLKSKAFVIEQTEKIKLLSDERKAKHQLWVDESKARIQNQKDALKQSREAHRIKVEQQKQDLKDEKLKLKTNYDNLRQQLRDNADARKKKLDQDRADHNLRMTKDRLQLQQDRADAAAKIKKLKGDLRDDYQTKMRAAKSDIAQKKADAMVKNKQRIQKIRDMTAEHKLRLKQIEDDAKGEALIKKAALKRELSENEKRYQKASRHADQFKDTLKQGALEANPLLHAGVDIYKGVKGLIGKQNGNNKLNKLQHSSSNAKGAKTGSTAPAPANGPSNGPATASSSGGGFLDGILGLIPSVSGILSGIGSLFTGIVGAFGKVGSFLLGGLRFVPVIAGVAAVIGGIWKFIEGFNDASSLFGEKIADDDYTKRIYSGFVNVVGSILGIFDTVAGWLGFDSDLEGSFKKGAVKLFDVILDSFRSIVGGLADLLDYIPGMGGVAKSMKEYAAQSSTGTVQPTNAPTPAASLSDKTNQVNNLQDDVNAKKSAPATVQVVTDNSVKSNNTTMVNQKMTTRNNDQTVALYGYGAMG